MTKKKFWIGWSIFWGAYSVAGFLVFGGLFWIIFILIHLLLIYYWANT